MQRNTRWSLLAFAIAVAFTSLPAHAQSITWTPYTYELKSGIKIEAELGQLQTSLHHDRAGSKTTTLHFVKIPGLRPGSGVPIVYLAGGPGGSGIEAGRGDRWKLFEALRQEGDVILLDQRGVGLSSALPTCSTSWSFPSDEASTEASFNASMEAAASRCAEEWRAGGVDLSAYNTAENAADVADLARALGGHVRLVAISYGTFLAFAVLRDHGDLIDRVVLAGIEGPDHTLKLPTQADVALAGLSQAMARNPAAAKLTPNLKHSVETVLAGLERAPVWGEVKGKDGTTTRILISKYDVQMFTAFLMATTSNASRLPSLYAAMQKGDFSSAAQTVLWLRRFLAQPPAMALAMDAASPVSPQRERKTQALISRSLFGNAVNAPSGDFSRALGVPKIADRWRTPIKSNTPAYFISGDLDSRTPPGNAEEVRRGFSKSNRLLLQGAGHDNDLFLSSPVILERIGTFLRGEAVKDETVKVDILHFE